MADKLPQTVVVVPTFVDGEIPPAAKLTVLAQQMRAAARKTEKAVGDVLDQSFPYTAAAPTAGLSRPVRSLDGTTILGGTRWLDIVNLARLIGPASNLNPMELDNGTTVYDPHIIEDIPVGVYEFYTRYPIDMDFLLSAGFSFSGSGSVFTNLVATPDLLNSAGDYYVNERTSSIHSYSITTGGTVRYPVHPSENGGITSPAGSSFNVIPDLAQLEAGGDGLISGGVDGDGRYIFTTPTVSHQTWNYDHSTEVLDDGDINFEQQLLLPSVLADAFDGLGSPPYQIPEGFCVLKNYTTGKAYVDATIYWASSTEIRVGNVDLDEELADSNKLYLATVGTDITSSIADLRWKTRFSGLRSLGQVPVDVRDIVGWLVNPGVDGKPYGPSRNTSNPAPQYLHRDGYLADDDGAADNNVMRGDLVLGKVIAGALAGGAYATGTSHKLAFGTLTQAWIGMSGTALSYYSNGTHVFTGDTTFHDHVTIEDGADISGGLYLGDAGEALGPGDEGTGYLRWPRLTTWSTPEPLHGYLSIKNLSWAALSYRPITYTGAGAGPGTGWPDLPVWFHDYTQPDFISILPGSNTDACQGFALLDLSLLFNGAGSQTAASALAVVGARIEVITAGSDQLYCQLVATLFLDGNAVGTNIVIDRSDNGWFDLMPTALENDAFQISKNSRAMLQLVFTNDGVHESPRFAGVEFKVRNKYLAGV